MVNIDILYDESFVKLKRCLELEGFTADIRPYALSGVMLVIDQETQRRDVIEKVVMNNIIKLSAFYSLAVEQDNDTMYVRSIWPIYDDGSDQ